MAVITLVRDVLILVIQFFHQNLARMKIMPMFSPSSFSKLSTCHNDLQVIFFEVIKTFDCTVLEGHRNQVEQDKDFEEGKTKLKWPNGKHNATPSNAVDIAPCPLDFSDTQRFHYFAGFVMGTAQRLKDEGKVTHSLRWGGDWNRNWEVKDENFRDLCHYELMVY